MSQGKLVELTERAYDEGRRLVAPLLGLPGVRMSGTNIKLAQQNASEHFKVIKNIVDTFSPDVAFPLMDLSVEANALARYTVIPVNDTAVVPKTDFHRDDIAKLRKIDLSYDARINSYVDTLRLMKIGLPESVVRAAYAIGPYSLAAMIMGAEDAAMATILQRDQLHELCRLALDTIHEYVGMLIRAKADPIVILEPTGVMLGPAQFEEFSGKYVRRLVESYRDVNIVYHICGSSMHLIDKLIESGVAGISLDSKDRGVDLVAVAKKTRGETVIIGNISTTNTLYLGTPDEVKREVRELLERMAPYPNFILSTACDIPQEVPLENIHAFMQAAREYRRR
jgi:uroporphyrinogen decarboxylase